MTIKYILPLLLFIFISHESFCQKNVNNYSNSIFGYEVSVPKDWNVYREVRNDDVKQRTLIDWGLPKIYSEIEDTEIENSVSIRAFKNKDIKSLNELIQNEYLRIDPTTTALEIEEKTNVKSRIIYHDSNGLKFKGKCYFEFNNGISYVITFMATPGTYDKNIVKFEEFYSKFSLK